MFTDKTNKKGEWAINGVGGGQWYLDFTKDGFETRKITVPINELDHVPPMEIAIKRVVVEGRSERRDRGELQKAAPLMDGGQVRGRARPSTNRCW